MIAPDDYEYPPDLLTLGPNPFTDAYHTAIHVAHLMYENPFETFPQIGWRPWGNRQRVGYVGYKTSFSNQWNIGEILIILTWLYSKGLIALTTSQDGYQLTAAGRMYFTLYLRDEAAKQEKRQKEYEKTMRYLEWEKDHWDDLMEARLREIDTY